MESVKRFSQSLSLLTVGLIILLSSMGFSLFALFGLEEAYEERKAAIDAQDIYDSVLKDIKDLTLIVSAPEIFEPNELGNMQRQIVDRVTRSIQAAVVQARRSNVPAELVIRFEKDLEQIANSGEVDWEDLQRLDDDLAQLNAIENGRADHHGELIFANIRRLTAGSIIGVIVAVSLIGYSVRKKKREDQRNLETIEELKVLKDAAEQSSMLKSQFLSTVSHEIRTPLNGIIGLSDILMKSDTTTSGRNLVATINSSGKILLRIISDILDFSKIESGVIDFDNVTFSVANVFHQVVMTLSPKAADKSLFLVSDIDPSIPRELVGDPERLSQVLFNLTGNAIKFTDRGSVVLRAKNVGLRDKQVRILFSVQDTGVGMSASELSVLFQPFVQTRKVGTSGEPGTGLGLSISRSIVRALDGDIHVESDVDVGSTFSFELDYAIGSNQSLGIQEAYNSTDFSHRESQTIALHYKPTILVAEDNTTNQIVAQSMLEQLDCAVISAANGEECIEVLKTGSVDLILMDCQMPVLDGFDATRAIRSQGNNIPIIAMTANISKDDEKKCRAAGMDGFISKPIDPNILRETLLDHLPGEKVLETSKLSYLDSTIGATARKKVVASYVKGLSQLRDELDLCSDESKLPELNRVAHRFKGSSETVGAVTLAELCRELENATSFESANSTMRKIADALPRLERSLRAFL